MLVGAKSTAQSWLKLSLYTLNMSVLCRALCVKTQGTLIYPRTTMNAYNWILLFSFIWYSSSAILLLEYYICENIRTASSRQSSVHEETLSEEYRIFPSILMLQHIFIVVGSRALAIEELVKPHLRNENTNEVVLRGLPCIGLCPAEHATFGKNYRET